MAVEFIMSPRRLTTFLFAKLCDILVFIQYTAVAGAGAGLVVSIDLVELGGEAVPGLKYEPVVFGQEFVASLADLWRMKARAHVVTRPGEKIADLGDYNWLLRRTLQCEIEYDPVELWEMLLGELKVRQHVFSRSHKNPRAVL
jgi:hypothetical protein